MNSHPRNTSSKSKKGKNKTSDRFPFSVLPKKQGLKSPSSRGLFFFSTAVREEFSFAKALNSSACQASVERAYSFIARFYDNGKKSIPGKKGYPKFKNNCRSVEYKTSGWKLCTPKKKITFTDWKVIAISTSKERGI